MFFYNYKYRYEWGELQSFGQLLILIIFLGARSRVKCSRVPQSGRGAQGRQLLHCPLQRWGRQDWFVIAISKSSSYDHEDDHDDPHTIIIFINIISTASHVTIVPFCSFSIFFRRDFLGSPAPNRAGKEWGILHRHSFHGEKHFCVLPNTPLTTFGKRF